MSVPLPLSILDLATVGEAETIQDGLDASVALAQRAEEWGFRRIWYAEHHNMRADRVVGDQRADRARRGQHRADHASAPAA